MQCDDNAGDFQQCDLGLNPESKLYVLLRYYQMLLCILILRVSLWSSGVFIMSLHKPKPEQ